MRDGGPDMMAIVKGDPTSDQGELRRVACKSERESRRGTRRRSRNRKGIRKRCITAVAMGEFFLKKRRREERKESKLELL